MVWPLKKKELEPADTPVVGGLRDRSRIRRGHVLAFVLVFVAIGGITIWRSFAATVGTQLFSSGDLISSGNISAPKKILEVSLGYSAATDPSLKITSSKILNGYISDIASGSGKYRLELVNSSGTILSKTKFDIPNTAHNDSRLFDSSAAGSGDLVQPNTDFIVNVPYESKATKVRLIYKGKQIGTSSALNLETENNKPNFDLITTTKAASVSKETTTSVANPTTTGSTGTDTTIDIVFVSDNYSSIQMAAFQNDVNKWVNTLASIEPYKSYYTQGKIKTYAVKNTASLGCKYDPKVTRVLLCSKSLMQDAVNKAGVPNDKVVVVRNDPNKFAGAAYGIGAKYAAFTNSSDAATVFVHELSHLMGLRDEYFYASDNYPAEPADNAVHANCLGGKAPPYPSAWFSLVQPSDYTPGCNDQGNWTSSTPCSLMKALNCFYFNTVSDAILKQALNGYVFGSMLPRPAPDRIIAPTQPVNLNSNGVSSRQINLSWYPSTDDEGVTAYAIYRNVNGVPVYYGITGATNMAVVGLSPSTSYSFSVTALDSHANESLASTTISSTLAATPVDTQSPTAPGSLTATATSPSSVNLSWIASSDNIGVVRYDIYRGSSKITSTSGTSLAVGGLSAATAYTFNVYALDAAGNRSSAATAIAITQNASSPPTTPTNLIAQGVSQTQINLSWGQSYDNEDGYNVLYQIFRNNILVVTVGSNSFNDSGLVSGSSYAYKVYAVDSSGALSSAATATGTTQGSTADTTKPTRPSNLVATQYSSTSAKLIWSASTDNVGVVGYRLYRSGYPLGSTPSTNYIDTNVSVCAFPGPYWEVEAFDGAGNTGPRASAQISGSLNC